MSSTDEEIHIFGEDILDVDLLITSVEERPLLWDKMLDSYSDRNKKRKCWRDIFCIMKPILSGSLLSPSKININAPSDGRELTKG